jgi:hypothetical protein
MRRFVPAAGVAALLMVAGALAFQPVRSSEPRIDRRALVTRHNPTLNAADRLAPLTLGNGEFAFTADITGLQTFPAYYERRQGAANGSTPLATQSQWGWHSFPNPGGYQPADAFAPYDSHGRSVQYASRQNTPAAAWLRENPHRLNLARIGFTLQRPDGTSAALDDLRNTEQTLDLWTGTLTSRFELNGRNVRVSSWVHPQQDALAVQVDRGGLPADQLAIRMAFPYASAVHSGDPSDWTKPDLHTTRIVSQDAGHVQWRRTVDADTYFVRLTWSGSAILRSVGPHEFLLSFAADARPFEFVAAFSADQMPADAPAAAAVHALSATHWQSFWESGGAIDLSHSTDPRAPELERRIVLSQYLTAIQSAGSMPPQETGLTYNSWFGKFHLEMHWWHAAHFALWDRLPLLERSLPWYNGALAAARATAERQGYKGARWPKMVGPEGRDSPSGVGVFLVWQQPHPIYLAELVYRQKRDRRTLEQYRDIVFESAEFMASFAVREPGKERYVLGPPLIPAQETHPPRTTFNPGFELAYWAWGLETAQQWRERLGLPRDPKWQSVLTHLSPLPSRDGLYVNAESAPDTFTNADERRDHPTLLGSCGMLPCTHADRETMRRTLREVMRSWNFERTWGWDYPLIAMTAARVGEPQIAIDALLMKTQKNTYLANGHNYQDDRLTIYLPGNGGLLAAAAMMAAGWDGAPDEPAPGFPREGWVVQWEGLRRMP